jgi:hypothetical protein
MPFTELGKNLMLDALRGTNPTTPITHTGAFDADPTITAATAQATGDTITKAAHGLANGNLVVLSALVGGTGLLATKPYFVIGSTTNTFQVARQPGGAAVDITVDYSSLSITRLVELSGGSPAYARGSIAFAAASLEQIDDSTNGVNLNVAAGATVDYVGFWSAATAGTLLAIDDVTPEVYAGQGVYQVQDAKLDLLAAV